jgi:hypothetical protein
MRAIFHLGFPERRFWFQSLDLTDEYRFIDPTATRWSQIAALLLFELGTIDIRRVGTT